MDAIEALTLDYQCTLGFIDKCDNHMFRIKNWALVTTSAVIAYCVSKGVANVVFANLILVPAFLYLELIYKVLQDDAIEHIGDVESRIGRALTRPVPDDLVDNYEFGFGHKLQYPSVARCARILRKSTRRHIVNFYGLIVVFSVAAFLWRFLAT